MIEAQCICAACLWSWKFHAHSDPWSLKSRNGKQMTACVHFGVWTVWTSRATHKSNRIKLTLPVTIPLPTNETQRNRNMQKLAPIHQIETAEALVSKALTCPRTPRGHVPMATPLAVPIVDLPVAWWPWRPRHHSSPVSRHHRRHHCIIASSRSVCSCFWLFLVVVSSYLKKSCSSTFS